MSTSDPTGMESVLDEWVPPIERGLFIPLVQELEEEIDGYYEEISRAIEVIVERAETGCDDYFAEINTYLSNFISEIHSSISSVYNEVQTGINSHVAPVTHNVTELQQTLINQSQNTTVNHPPHSVVTPGHPGTPLTTNSVNNTETNNVVSSHTISSPIGSAQSGHQGQSVRPPEGTRPSSPSQAVVQATTAAGIGTNPSPNSIPTSQSPSSQTGQPASVAVTGGETTVNVNVTCDVAGNNAGIGDSVTNKLNQTIGGNTTLNSEPTYNANQSSTSQESTFNIPGGQEGQQGKPPESDCDLKNPLAWLYQDCAFQEYVRFCDAIGIETDTLEEMAKDLAKSMIRKSLPPLAED